MEFSSFVLPITKNMCRTCLSDLNSDADTSLFMNIQDVVEHETVKVKLIDILVFLNCLQHNDEDNWPQGMCATCISTALMAYNFKLNCLKANATISQIFTLQTQSLESSDIDNIDISVVYQDHEYELPFFSSQSVLELDSLQENKEIIPLPPVTEITSTEHPPRKEGEKKYACNSCGKSFTRINGLKNHISKHNDYPKHLCSTCVSGLRVHKGSHLAKQYVTCEICHKNLPNKRKLQKHMNLHGVDQ
ncbi:unnamed protein product [Leptidea sinapis]|uniref:C2H2-type domain-containing protein n=1 Tax=Leptidea sinapis TaxID=189913 RepID=A0A5E4QEI6_9NEOP|nr:unnamed protein product [Leptidea sinapis]